MPAYTFPKNREYLVALRLVVKRGFSHDTADFLINDMKQVLPRLKRQPAPVHDSKNGSGFHH